MMTSSRFSESNHLFTVELDLYYNALAGRTLPRGALLSRALVFVSPNPQQVGVVRPAPFRVAERLEKRFPNKAEGGML